MTSDLALVFKFDSAPNFSTSDHSSIKFEISGCVPLSAVCPRYVFRHAGWNQIKTFLGRIRWDAVFFGLPTIDDMCNCFVAYLRECIHLFVCVKLFGWVKKLLAPPLLNS